MGMWRPWGHQGCGVYGAQWGHRALGDIVGMVSMGAVVSMGDKVSMGDICGHKALGDIRDAVSIGTWCPWDTMGTWSPWGHQGCGVYGAVVSMGHKVSMGTRGDAAP